MLIECHSMLIAKYVIKEVGYMTSKSVDIPKQVRDDMSAMT